jgi:CheY-like chemotaxis protein
MRYNFSRGPVLLDGWILSRSRDDGGATIGDPCAFTRDRAMMDSRPFEGWFCRRGEEVVGPLNRAQLRQFVRQGRLRPEDTLWGQRLPDGELIAPVEARQVLRRDRFAALVVDDDVVAADLLARLLRDSGADDCVACTGDEAPRTTAAFEPDAVFFDLDLPCPAGYALACALRDLPQTPRVVPLTGDDSPSRRRGLREAGFRHWLRKPADADHLREVLSHLGRPAT